LWPTGSCRPPRRPCRPDRPHRRRVELRDLERRYRVVNVAIAIIDRHRSGHPDLSVAGGVNRTGRSFDDGNGHGTHVAGITAAKTTPPVSWCRAGCAAVCRAGVQQPGFGPFACIICGID
jgi:hypothetical protein